MGLRVLFYKQLLRKIMKAWLNFKKKIGKPTHFWGFANPS